MSAPARPPRPATRRPAPWQFPQPQHFPVGQLSGYSYHVPGQHILSVRVAVPLAITHEPARVEGVGQILAGTLTEGTRTHDAMAFADLVERLGATIAVHAGERSVLLDLDVPARNLTSALNLLVSMLTEPAFTPSAVDREVRRALAGIASARAHPGHRAALEFAATYFDSADRLSRPVAGTEDTVRAIDQEAVVRHAGALGPAGSTVVLAGDLSGIDAPGVLGAAFSPWAGGPLRPASSPPPGTRAADAARIVVVDRPGSVQSELIIGAAGPDRRVPGGWAPYPVCAYLLGGAPNSRLDAELRERRGYTYGIRSMYRPRSRGGQFLTSGSVRSEVTGAAVELALEILDAAREGFTQAETTSGVDYLVKTAPARYETADMIADEAIARALDGSDTTEVTRVLADMDTLTPQRVSEAYRRYADGQWTVVVVGDAGRFADSLAALGRGGVTVVR